MTSRPNLLFIHSNQHSPRVLGCAGDSLDVTPHVDALAATGTVCDAIYCPSPLRVPSRMASLTVLIFADGWDPQRIDRRFAQRDAELAVLSAWARHAQPAETHRWPLTASMHQWDESSS